MVSYGRRTTLGRVTRIACRSKGYCQVRTFKRSRRPLVLTPDKDAGHPAIIAASLTERVTAHGNGVAEVAIEPSSPGASLSRHRARGPCLQTSEVDVARKRRKVDADFRITRDSSRVRRDPEQHAGRRFNSKGQGCRQGRWWEGSRRPMVRHSRCATPRRSSRAGHSRQCARSSLPKGRSSPDRRRSQDGHRAPARLRDPPGRDGKAADEDRSIRCGGSLQCPP